MTLRHLRPHPLKRQMSDHMQKRIDRIQQILKSKKLDGVLVSSRPVISYLTGYYGFSDTEREAYLLLTKKSNYLITDARYSEATTSRVSHFTTLERSSEKNLTELLKELAKKEHLKKIAFEDTDIRVSEYAALKKTQITLAPIRLHSLRSVKEIKELQAIQKATKIALKAFKAVKTKITPGIAEIEVAKLLEDEMRKQGATPSFPSIVAFGKNSSVPHHLTGSTKLKKNDVVLMDFGAKWQGYCSDNTRTFFVGNVPSRWKKIYHTVETAQKMAIDYLQSESQNKKGHIEAMVVDTISREYILSQNYQSIPHSLGHGIGLEVHEAPSLSPYTKDLLTDGMVFSIEPGIYIPGKIGVRIEDLFTIKGSILFKIT